jgi:predicted lipid-binding transport protein (Tim44 family)
MRVRRTRLVAIAVCALLLLVCTLAWARPGGGSSFSGGSSSRSSSSSSSSSSGGSSDGGGAIVELLIWLCIEHPAVGIPLVIIVIIVAVVKNKLKGSGGDWSTSSDRPVREYAPVAVAPPRASFDGIKQADPTFSPVIFEDFLYSLYAEVQRGRGAGMLDRLSAYISPAAAQSLMQLPRGEVQGVIVGAMRVLRAAASPGGAFVEVEFETNYTEAGRGYYVVERWSLARRAGARSRTPDRVRVLGCPGCGAPQEALFSGKCRHCGRVVNDGSFDWVVQTIQVASRENRAPALTADVAEQGTNLRSVVDAGLGPAVHALRTKDPAFDVPQFQQRVGLVFNQFQIAWSARNLAQMRPFMSDALFSTQEYYVAAYTAQRLRNITERARITNMELVKIASDPYFDAVTVRLWATGLDYTVTDDGKVVSGSKSRERVYSEYWTLIRGTNRKGPAKTELACANCGAPLSVNMVGHCNYCKVKVTTGDFDWVLSRIEQDEAYSG